MRPSSLQDLEPKILTGRHFQLVASFAIIEWTANEMTRHEGIGMTPKEILEAGWQAVMEANLPDDLRLVAYEKAIDVIMVQQHGAASLDGRPTQSSSARQPESSGELSLLDKVAEKLKLDRDTVDQVFTEHDGLVHISISPRQLHSTAKGATEQLALLVCAARQGAGQEGVTQFSEIRSTLTEFGKLNPGNFAGYVAGMKGKLLITGSGASRTAKLNRPGWTAAADLVQQLTGTSGGES